MGPGCLTTIVCSRRGTTSGRRDVGQVGFEAPGRLGNRPAFESMILGHHDGFCVLPGILAESGPLGRMEWPRSQVGISDPWA